MPFGDTPGMWVVVARVMGTVGVDYLRCFLRLEVCLTEGLTV